LALGADVLTAAVESYCVSQFGAAGARRTTRADPLRGGQLENALTVLATPFNSPSNRCSDRFP
jgi:hypothetical protein